MVKLFGNGIGCSGVYKSTNGTTNPTNQHQQICRIRIKFVNLYTERFARRGFSLAELLVSIGIFMLITGVVIVNFRSSERSTELRLGTQELVTYIRNAQTLSYAGKGIDLCLAQNPTCQDKCVDDENANKVCTGKDEFFCENGCIESVPKGYGVHIDLKNVILFADGNGNKKYDADEQVPGAALLLSPALLIKDFSPQATDLSQPDLQYLDIVFALPGQQVFINTQEKDAAATIVLKHNKTDQEKTIVVHRISGVLEIQ